MEITVDTLLSRAPRSSYSLCAYSDTTIVGIAPIPSKCLNFAQDIIYYGNTQELDFSKVSNGNFILFSNNNQNDFSDNNCNFIIVNDYNEYRGYIDEIEEIFANEVRLMGIASNMSKIIQTSRNLESLLEYGYTLLNNPIMVSDMSFNYVTSVGTDSIHDEPVWQYAIQNKTFPPNYISSLLGQFSEEQNTEKFRLLMIDKAKTNGLEHAQYSATMVQNNHILGYVKLLDYNHTPSQFDTQVLMQMAVFASIIVGNDMGNTLFNRSINESFIEAILRGRIVDPEEIVKKHDTLNIRLFKYKCVISVNSISGNMPIEQIFLIYRELKNIYLGCHVVILDGSFVVLYDNKDSEEHPPELLDRLASLLLKNRCTANISMPFTKIEDLCTYYNQTIFCNSMRSELAIEHPVLFYSDIYYYHMLDHFGRLVDLKKLIHPVLRTLIQEDEKTEGNLTETLLCYLENQENIATSAKKMGIHYNTMKNRIARITALAQPYVFDSSTRFQIELSACMLRVIKNQG